MSLMSDLVTRLRDAAKKYVTDDATVLEIVKRTPCALLIEAADEIERLRSLAGAVSPGQTVTQIKEMLRRPDQWKMWNG